MCINCAKEVRKILDEMDENGEWEGLSNEEKDVQRQLLGMRIRKDIICPEPTQKGYAISELKYEDKKIINP